MRFGYDFYDLDDQMKIPELEDFPVDDYPILKNPNLSDCAEKDAPPSIVKFEDQEYNSPFSSEMSLDPSEQYNAPSSQMSLDPSLLLPSKDLTYQTTPTKIESERETANTNDATLLMSNKLMNFKLLISFLTAYPLLPRGSQKGYAPASYGPAYISEAQKCIDIIASYGIIIGYKKAIETISEKLSLYIQGVKETQAWLDAYPAVRAASDDSKKPALKHSQGLQLGKRKRDREGIYKQVNLAAKILHPDQHNIDDITIRKPRKPKTKLLPNNLLSEPKEAASTKDASARKSRKKVMPALEITSVPKIMASTKGAISARKSRKKVKDALEITKEALKNWRQQFLEKPSTKSAATAKPFLISTSSKNTTTAAPTPVPTVVPTTQTKQSKLKKGRAK
jgi:hypothetical protein